MLSLLLIACGCTPGPRQVVQPGPEVLPANAYQPSTEDLVEFADLVWGAWDGQYALPTQVSDDFVCPLSAPTCGVGAAGPFADALVERADVRVAATRPSESLPHCPWTEPEPGAGLGIAMALPRAVADTVVVEVHGQCRQERGLFSQVTEYSLVRSASGSWRLARRDLVLLSTSRVPVTVAVRDGATGGSWSLSPPGRERATLVFAAGTLDELTLTRALVALRRELSAASRSWVDRQRGRGTPVVAVEDEGYVFPWAGTVFDRWSEEVAWREFGSLGSLESVVIWLPRTFLFGEP